MVDFFKRNAPVLIIGIVTLLIFVAIIALSQGRVGPRPALEKVDQKSLITSTTQTQGNANAPVTIVEFGDFQCPGCAFFFPYLENYYKDNKDTVRIAFRNFPLPMHTNAHRAAEAAVVAAKYGKFWEYAGTLFSNQENLERSDLIKYASQVGMDAAAFTKDLDSGASVATVEEDVKAGNDLGINSTPTIYVNGEKLFFTTFDDLTKQIDQAINAARKPGDQQSTPTTTVPTTAPTPSSNSGY
ncbi:MAG TPA: thioredoxin domain-containing protein [Candidatus Saccharimonadales bacterium]|nr:thioredoxin domain-containing protein [Candidatus Saccharimonadales bacterium]